MAGGVLALIQAGDALAGERERHTLEALLGTNVSGIGLYLGKTLAVALYGWTFGVIVLLVNVVTTFVRGTGGLPVGTLTVAALAALPLVVPMAMLGILVSARSATVRQAHQTTMSLVLVVVAAPSLLIGGIVAVVPRDGEPPAWLRGLVQGLLPLAELGTTGWLMVGVAVALLLSVALFLLGRASFERDRLSSV
jgi:ABC-type Na+ efflux pump permease subunit